MPGVGPYWWSARWDGELQAQYSEPYALQVVSDDRARVWLDGTLLIDEWYDHAASVSSAMVNLEAGKHYALRVDYFQNRGGATLKLLWSSPSTPQQIIPQSQLYSKTSVMSPQDLQQMYQAELAPQPGAASSEACPPGWSRADVGLVGVEGQVQVSNGSWAVSGAGADIWANEDGCCFVFQPLSGDGQITARVLSQQDTDPWAKAGIMIREGLGADARHLMLAVTPEQGLGCLYRPEPAAETTLDDGGAFSGPLWLRLVRSCSQISAFQSSDGTNWVWVASEEFDWVSNALVGLAVSSHDNSTPGTATFDQVAVEPVASGPGAQPELGTGNGLNATYFDGSTGAIVSRIDPQVNFDWDFGSPAQGIGPENFSAGWSGWIEAQYDEIYALHILSDDGARLWLDDQLLIDAWTDRAAQQSSARVSLSPGVKRALRVEYYQRSREAIAKLLWSSPSTPKQPVPSTQLYADLALAAPGGAGGQGGTAAAALAAGLPVASAAGGSAQSAGGGPTNGAVPANTYTSIVNVLEIPGAEATATLGRWKQEGKGLYAVDRRGYVEYALIAPAADMYRLEIEGASHNPDDIDPGFWLAIAMDGELLENLLLDVPPHQTATVHTLTPFTKPGLHRVRIAWDNARKGRSLELLAVRLQSLQGPSSGGDGLKDWVVAQLKSACGVETAEISPGRLQGATSPMCVEGRGRFLSMMEIRTGTGLAAAQPGAGDRWFADVPLLADKLASIKIAYQNGGLQERWQAEWIATDVLAGGNITIRRGDSLLLALGADRQPGRMEVHGVTNYTLAGGQAACHHFEKAGTFTIAVASGSSKLAASRPGLTVRVVHAGLGGPVAAWVGKPRTWACPSLPQGVVLDAAPLLNLQASRPGGYQICALTSGVQCVLARLGTNGPVLAQLPVQGFQIYSADQTDFEVTKTYADGTDLIEMGLVASPALPEVQVQVALVVGGVVFDDGTVVKRLAARDFDALGQYTVRFLRPGTSKTSTCHTLKGFQGTIFLGQR